ncbi:MAG: flagellar hook-length control protein FliK, partial [Planctomycetes bacterium]|nr:flagellar hook-length control protein FliK [Planctomycetota bacterium]
GDRRVDDVDAEVPADADALAAAGRDEAPTARADHGDDAGFATLPTDAGQADAAATADGNGTPGLTVADQSLADRGSAARREAGEGEPPARAAAKPSAEPLLAAVLHAGPVDQAAPAPVAVAAANGNATGAIGATRAVDAPTPGSHLPALRPPTPLAGAAVTGSYRTNNAASAELLAQARDSVFQQILVKLAGDGGGEMRLVLQPPDLGQLDLRLVMDQGNRLSLTIAAERQDMAHLLQRHLDELKQTLQQAGLDVAGAEVQTRSEYERQRREQDAAPQGAVTAAEPAPTGFSDSTRPRGVLRADGLDFWA